MFAVTLVLSQSTDLGVRIWTWRSADRTQVPGGCPYVDRCWSCRGRSWSARRSPPLSTQRSPARGPRQKGPPFPWPGWHLGRWPGSPRPRYRSGRGGKCGCTSLPVWGLADILVLWNHLETTGLTLNKTVYTPRAKFNYY